MEVTAVAQLRRMVLEHLSRYTWNDVLIDHVYDILHQYDLLLYLYTQLLIKFLLNMQSYTWCIVYTAKFAYTA